MGERIRNEVSGDDYTVGRKPTETTRASTSSNLSVKDGQRIGELTLRNKIAKAAELKTTLDHGDTSTVAAPVGPEPPKPGTFQRTSHSPELEGEFIVTPRIEAPRE